MAKMTNRQFVETALNIANNYSTIYAIGTIGNPVTETLITQKAKQYPNWYTATIQSKLKLVVGKNYFAFDCVGMIKSVLWGWTGDNTKSNGGAVYQSNGVPDINANTMFNKCTNISQDFKSIEVGEIVWVEGHVGVYIGNGLAVECTPKWKNKVQITACNCDKAGYNRRDWAKHGKSPYIEYVKTAAPTTQTVSVKMPVLQRGKKGNAVKALQVLLNGNGARLDIDGSFGGLTETAVNNYQKSKGLDVDGVVGSATWTKLFNE